VCTWADLTAVIGFHPNLKPLQRHKGVRLRCSVPLDRLAWPSVVTSARSSFVIRSERLGLGATECERTVASGISAGMEHPSECGIG
jgi:hypothetical protein